MKTGKRNTIVTVVIMFLIAAAVIFGFYQIQRMSKGKSSGSTEVEKLLAKDLDKSYPNTPSDVLKFYIRITKCYYNVELSADELEGLARQAYRLFDEELQEKNPYDEFLINLQADIEAFETAGRTISTTEVERASNTERKTQNGVQYASLLGAFNMKEKGKATRTVQRYHFRKNDADEWRILYWEVTEDTLQ